MRPRNGLVQQALLAAPANSRNQIDIKNRQVIAKESIANAGPGATPIANAAPPDSGHGAAALHLVWRGFRGEVRVKAGEAQTRVAKNGKGCG
jgi:hypothetical protein